LHRQRVVRSVAQMPFHGNVYEAAMAPLRASGIDGRVIGGGRIEYYPEHKSISVYG